VLQNEEYAGTLKIVGEPFTEEFYGIAVKKGNTEILELINKGLAEVLASDLPEQLADKWLR
jgi:polar amino acid transport system substrate-binding protein